MDSILTPETTVLIVDDSTQYATVLTKMLQSAFGYTDINVVDAPEKALELIREHKDRFQLLFVDYNFPSGENGGALLETLSAEGFLEDRIAFLITSEPNAENVDQAQKAGARGVVAKPFDRQELAQQLEKAERAIQLDNTDSF